MGFVVVIITLFKTPINRTFNQVNSILGAKGKVIEPESEEISDWVKSLKEEDENTTTKS